MGRVKGVRGWGEVGRVKWVGGWGEGGRVKGGRVKGGRGVDHIQYLANSHTPSQIFHMLNGF